MRRMILTGFLEHLQTTNRKEGSTERKFSIYYCDSFFEASREEERLNCVTINEEDDEEEGTVVWEIKAS